MSQMDNLPGFCRTCVIDGMVLIYTAAESSPEPIRSFSFAWAISRPTIMVPVSDRRVETGYCDNWARISFIGRLRIDFHRAFARLTRRWRNILARIVFQFFDQMPSRLFRFDVTRSAERETPHPHRTGKRRDAAGGITREYRGAKYFPANWAPRPSFALLPAVPVRVEIAECWPCSLPSVGSAS